MVDPEVMKKIELQAQAHQLGSRITRRFADHPNSRDVARNVKYSVDKMNIEFLELLNQDWVFNDDMFQSVIDVNRYYRHNGVADRVRHITQERVTAYLKTMKAVDHVCDLVPTAHYGELMNAAFLQTDAGTELVCKVLVDRLPVNAEAFYMWLEQVRTVSSPSLSSGVL